MRGCSNLCQLQALSTKREYPWGVKRYTLVHAAIYLQLAWFSSELVLASTAVALAPRIMGEPSCLVLCICTHHMSVLHVPAVHTA